jgi:hypothetical protein
MWKKLDVIGPECEINESGQIRQKRIIILGREIENYIRPPLRDKNNKMYQTFRLDRMQINRYVHAMVAKYFVHNPHELSYITFKDGNVNNVHASNLEWCKCTPKMAVKKPLTQNQRRRVYEIRRLAATGMKQKDIAKRFNMHASTISLIVNRKRQCR